MIVLMTALIMQLNIKTVVDLIALNLYLALIPPEIFFGEYVNNFIYEQGAIIDLNQYSIELSLFST